MGERGRGVPNSVGGHTVQCTLWYSVYICTLCGTPVQYGILYHICAIYILLLLQPKAEATIEDNKDDIKEHAMEEEEEKPVPEVVPEGEAVKPPEAAEQRIEMEEEEEEEEEGEPKYIPRLLDGAGKGIPVTIFISYSIRQCCGSGMFIPDPGSRILIFTHPGSRISDPGSKNSYKRER